MDTHLLTTQKSLHIRSWIFFVFLTLLIHLSLRKQDSFIGSLGISLLMNIVSMGIGLLLPL